MTRRWFAVAILLALSAGSAHAQSVIVRPKQELGFRSGWTMYREQGESFSVISVPGTGFIIPGTLHWMFFPSASVGAEAQLGFIRVSSSGGGSASGAVQAGVQLNQFLGGTGDDDAPFAFITTAAISGFGSGSSDTFFAAGGGAGYRWVVGESMGIRVEGRYRRMFGDAAFADNEFSVLIGIGALFGGN